MLRGSRRTGRARLVDHTASIDCVIAPASIAAASHQCAHACTLPSGGTRSYRCPYLHLSTLGEVVRITHFRVVAERFVTGCFPTVSDTKCGSYVKEMKVCCYLTFSMHDVVCLRRQGVDGKHVESSRSDDLHRSARKVCPLDECSECDNTHAKTSRSCGFHGSLPLNQDNGRTSRTCAVNQQSVSTERENTKSEILPGGCASSMENTQSSQHMEQRNIDTHQTKHESVRRPSQVFLVTRKDALRVKHRINSKPALSFFVAVQFLGEPRLAKVNNDSEASSDKLIVRHVVLDVHGSAVSLYPALHVGCLYRLVNMNSTANAGSISGLSSSGRLKKALETTDTCQCVRVDDGLTILPMCSLPTTSYGRQLEVWRIYTVHDTLHCTLYIYIWYNY